MSLQRRTLATTTLVLAGLLWLTSSSPLLADASWPQWGGPNGDFTCEPADLATQWPESGPAEVWSRELGPGNSTILHEDGVLYTTCRRGDQDVVVAMDAKTGKTRWEFAYDAPPESGMLQDYGVGPHSTPLLAGDRLFTIGAMTHFHCLDKTTGKVLWSHDMKKEYGVACMLRGYGASPIPYKDTVIVSVGPNQRSDEAAGFAAFNQKTGEIVWKSEILPPGYPTPIIATVHGQDMLITCLGTRRFALDPATGKTLWMTRVDSQSASVISSPLWIPPDKVLFTCGHGGGTRLFQIKPDPEKEGTFTPEELWYYNKFRIMHGNAVRIGDCVYGSHGDLGPAYLMAVDLATGKPHWRERGFSKATLLACGDSLIILDEDGQLAAAKASSEKLAFYGKARVLEKYAFAAPTLIGTRLYLRDNHVIKCLDLGKDANRVAATSQVSTAHP